MSHYRLKRDTHGQTVLYRRGDPFDVMLLTDSDVEPALWELIVRGAGLDDTYELVPRAEYDEMCTDIQEYYGVAL